MVYWRLYDRSKSENESRGIHIRKVVVLDLGRKPQMKEYIRENSYMLYYSIHYIVYYILYFIY